MRKNLILIEPFIGPCTSIYQIHESANLVNQIHISRSRLFEVTSFRFIIYRINVLNNPNQF